MKIDSEIEENVHFLCLSRNIKQIDFVSKLTGRMATNDASMKREQIGLASDRSEFVSKFSVVTVILGGSVDTLSLAIDYLQQSIPVILIQVSYMNCHYLIRAFIFRKVVALLNHYQNCTEQRPSTIQG